MAARKRLSGVVSVTGTARVARNLRLFRDQVRAEIRQVTLDNGYEAYSIARRICPVRTGRLRKSITLDTDHIEKLRITLFYDPEHYVGVPYYAPFVEFGTRFMAARPSLGPAFNQVAPRFFAEVKSVLRRKRNLSA